MTINLLKRNQQNLPIKIMGHQKAIKNKIFNLQIIKVKCKINKITDKIRIILKFKDLNNIASIKNSQYEIRKMKTVRKNNRKNK